LIWEINRLKHLAAIKKQDTELSILQIPLDKDWQIKHNIRVTGQPAAPTTNATDCDKGDNSNHQSGCHRAPDEGRNASASSGCSKHKYH
jgi:hypothetical protein